MAWRCSHAAAGPPGQDATPPERRSGLLWQHYGELIDQGYRLDATSYTTAFRMRPREGGDDEDVVREELPEGLASSSNLGAVDVYPATSGKVGMLWLGCRACGRGAA